MRPILTYIPSHPHPPFAPPRCSLSLRQQLQAVAARAADAESACAALRSEVQVRRCSPYLIYI